MVGLETISNVADVFRLILRIIDSLYIRDYIGK